jgi:hypothetical protein
MVGDDVLTFDTRGIGLVPNNDNRLSWTFDVTVDMTNYLMDFGGIRESF